MYKYKEMYFRAAFRRLKTHTYINQFFRADNIEYADVMAHNYLLTLGPDWEARVVNLPEEVYNELVTETFEPLIAWTPPE